MDVDTFQNVCLAALALVCLYLFKQKESVDALENRMDKIVDELKLGFLDLDKPDS